MHLALRSEDVVTLFLSFCLCYAYTICCLKEKKKKQTYKPLLFKTKLSTEANTKTQTSDFSKKTPKPSKPKNPTENINNLAFGSKRTNCNPISNRMSRCSLF